MQQARFLHDEEHTPDRRRVTGRSSRHATQFVSRSQVIEVQTFYEPGLFTCPVAVHLSVKNADIESIATGFAEIGNESPVPPRIRFFVEELQARSHLWTV